MIQFELYHSRVVLRPCEPSTINDYAKDGGQGGAWLFVVFTIILCALKLNWTLITLLYQVVRPSDHQVIPSHGNPQMRWTLFDGYLFKYCSVKYQTFHQVSEKTSQQTYFHQKATWKSFQMPQRAIKHQLTLINRLSLLPAVFWLVREAIWSFPGIAWQIQLFLATSRCQPANISFIPHQTGKLVSQSIMVKTT